MPKELVERISKEFNHKFKNNWVFRISETYKAKLRAFIGASCEETYQQGVLQGYRMGYDYCKKDIEKLIVEELVVSHKEGTPTSRLTSLQQKITKIK